MKPDCLLINVIMQGSTLTDSVLIVKQVVMILPVVVVLIVLSATGFHFTDVEVQRKV